MKTSHPETHVTKAVARQLARFFTRNGYVRTQNKSRLATEPGRYKKGDEVRLIAKSDEELHLIRKLLEQAGFRPGRPFKKELQYGQPIYGKQEVARFLRLVQTNRTSSKSRRPARSRSRRRA